MLKSTNNTPNREQPSAAYPPYVLVGTPETVRTARDMLAAAGDVPDAVGCILLDSRQPRAAGGLRVLGGLDDLSDAQRQTPFSMAVVCLPAAMSDGINRVRAALRKHGIQERFVPPVHDLLSQAPPYPVGLPSPAGAGLNSLPGVMVGGPRVDISHLMGRTPHPIDHASIERILAGKRVLITGAGGSIGSEIARIVCAFRPSQVQLMERAENALFEIDRQVARKFPSVPRAAILHDVTDAEQTLRLLVDLRPQVVFHAAAHKHVPLMEDHPAHAVTNNLFGTRSIADASLAVGAERFVMISTDKAVNPTSVMGATKRLAEMYIQWLNGASQRMAGATGAGTRFSMVRFGNVIGSACSVLTIWSAQLAEGGPITVTDPRMTRYFMTIPEAAALVIQASALDARPVPAGPVLCPGATVYVLDMGEPVEILELAQRFVRAHGFEPRVIYGTPGQASIRVEEKPGAEAPGLRPTIDIQITGIRPGEKLHEELSYAAEELRPAGHPAIRAMGSIEPPANCAAMIADLSSVRGSRDREAVLAAIRRHLPQMAPPIAETAA